MIGNKIKRRRLSPAERQIIYDKLKGHCACCGKKITLSQMQVDHVKSLYGKNGTDTIENMLPACRNCNHYKGSCTLGNDMFTSPTDSNQNKTNVPYVDNILRGKVIVIHVAVNCKSEKEKGLT